MGTKHTNNKLASLKKNTGIIKNISVTAFELKMPFEDFAARFADAPGTVLLLSGGDLDCARYHLLAIQPWLEIKSRGRNVSFISDNTTLEIDADPFDALRQIITAYALAFDDAEIPVAAGLFGYLSYDLKDYIEALPRTTVDDQGLPQMCFFAPSVILIHDKFQNQTRLCVLERENSDGHKIDTAFDIRAEFERNCDSLPKCYTSGATGLTSSFSKSEYMEAVKRIKKYIVSGDIYQANLSQRFETGFSGNAFSMFLELYHIAPGPFYAYIHAGDHKIVSTSPERFLKRSGKNVETRPIKGTRPRGKNPSEDQSFRDALLKSQKDDAELSMIVDLMRNDLGRVCGGGSVIVTEHKRLEAYHNVFHLVSRVQGKLAADKDSIDLIKATFPGGSITGCPRIRSMEVIDELEPVRRHIYTGSIGYLSFHDTLDLSIAIRTATVYRNRLFFSVGGGVVFDSDPADEYAETLHKGRSLMDVLQHQKSSPSGKKWIWQNGRLLPEEHAVISVKDLGLQYGLGCFETICVKKGHAEFLNDHIQRFYRAWEALFNIPTPDLTWDTIIDQLIEKNQLQNETAAVKMMATFGEASNILPHRPNLIVSAAKYRPRPAMINKGGLDLAIYPHPRQSPLSEHKTLNYAYYYLAGKWAAQQGADEALILNPDGSVSESNTANILLINGKNVIRPKSAHVLPGIMEKQMISYLVEHGYDIKSRKIMPEELPDAQQVLLSNSLMGPVPVLHVDNKKCNGMDGRFRKSVCGILAEIRKNLLYP